MLSFTSSGSICLLLWILSPGSLGFRIEPNRLQPRRDEVFQCLYAAYTPCGNGLYGDMCCDSDSTCLVTAANTTGICCPNGSDCTAMAPLSCNIDLQDWRVYPDTTVMTMALHQSLPECDDKCCPHGFVCVSGRGGQGSHCALDPDQETYTTLMPKMPGFVDDSAVSVTFPTKNPASTPVSAPGSTILSAQSTSSRQSTLSTESASRSRNTAPPIATDGTVSDIGEQDGEVVDEPEGRLDMAVKVGAPVGAALLMALLVFLWFRRRSILQCCRRRSPTPPPKPDSYLLSSKSTYSASVVEIDSNSCPVEMAAHPYQCPEMSGESRPCELPPHDPLAIPWPQGFVELPATPVRKPVSVVPLSVWNKRDVSRYERPKSYYSYHNSP